VQSLQILAEVLPILLLGDSIHSHRRVAPEPMVSALQSLLVDEMSEGVKLSFGFFSRSFHYLQQSR
jgi:hypothetical protein